MELTSDSINMIDRELEVIEKIAQHLSYRRWGMFTTNVAIAIYLKRRDDIKLEDDDE